MSIEKQINCAKCESFIHTTERCNIWHNKLLCLTDSTYKENCTCEFCIDRCIYCNGVTSKGLNKCWYHENRCNECNEYTYGGCYWNHSKPLCKFCNLPIWKDSGACYNNHNENDAICPKCNMPENPTILKHEHDDETCKVCNTLLNEGRCIYGCVNGGKFCMYCNYEGVVNNVCGHCKKNNTGHLTKRAMK